MRLKVLAMAALAIASYGLLLSCKSGSGAGVQVTSDRQTAVADRRAPLLADSLAAYSLVSKELDDGRIRLTPYARSLGLRRQGGMTGLPLDTPGAHCNAQGENDLFGVTITYSDPYGNYYNLGYCVNRYTGDINAYSDSAYSLTMRGNHSAWNPL